MWNLKLLDKFCRSTKPINFHKSPSIISVELYIASWHRKINYSAVVDMDADAELADFLFVCL